MTVDPPIPVPPEQYGGIERIVDMLVRGLLDRGHEVTLFAHPESIVPCRLVPYPSRPRRGESLVNTWHVSAHILRGRFDLVHSHARLAYLLPILPLSIPKIMTYGRHISRRSIEWGNRLSRGTLYFTGVSRYLLRDFDGFERVHTIHNAADERAHTFHGDVSADAPLVFLGRLEEIKGPHLAIDVAKRSGRRLILAGNRPSGCQHDAYFREKIEPYLHDDSIKYIGPVNDSEKNKLLGTAAALLMPILWDEPFGMVMAEAFACGTPVVALNRGAVREIVDDGVTGFVCDSVEEMVGGVNRIHAIRREECWRAMENRFSSRVMVSAYERLYMDIVGAGKSATQTTSGKH
jgi:glycosyltransferase involved in cell wall biosynthesis